MNRWDKFLKIVSMISGVAALGFFIYDFIYFEELRPRMVAFEPVTAKDEQMVILTGIGLLIFSIFCLASLLRFMNHIRHARKINLIYIALVVCGVVSLLFVFGDMSLLSDIGKQHSYGFAQPEWLVLYIVIGFQVITTLTFLYFHQYQLKREELIEEIALDNNIFLTVQFVGLLCGLGGLASNLLGYHFPKAWSLKTHTTMGLILIMLPYVFMVGYWLLNKLFGKERQFYDEKQFQDISRSALITLVFSAVFMVGLFILNYNDLGGITSILWLPLYLYAILFMFSLGNIYFNWKE